MKQITKDFNKVIKVLRSCEDHGHLIVAENMWDNFRNMYQKDKAYKTLSNIQHEEYINVLYRIP